MWLDEQSGSKPPVPADGVMQSSEKKIEGVLVKLYNKSGQVTKNLAGESLTNIRTDKNGRYDFKNLEIRTDYYIIFEYDGVNFETTVPQDLTMKIDRSHVTEVGRTTFNKKFQTINSDTKIDGKALEYEETIVGESNKSTLKTTNPLTTTNGNVKMGTVYEQYKMTATTKSNTYLKAADEKNWGVTSDSRSGYMNINMGLQKREFNLSLHKYLETVKITINGETEVKTYEQVKDEIDLSRPTVSPVTYSVYIFNSDYNYRQGDYKNENGNDLEVIEQLAGDELNVEVKYQIALNNESTHGGSGDAVKVNKIVEYIDVNYTVKSIKLGDTAITVPTNPETVTIDGKQYKKLDINLGGISLASGETKKVEIILTMNKDAQGKIKISKYDNIAEITEYYTDGGFVDNQSAPGNAIKNGKLHGEKDTAKAPGLNVKIGEERTITGTVWEDKKTETSGDYKHGNGTIDSDENAVDDVIVQLIEIKKAGDIPELKGMGLDPNTVFEYIWQETTSGGSKVNTMLNDGKGLKSEDVKNANGEYTFKDFIPGNYIIRFIYGDGTYIDKAPGKTTNAKTNTLKYNGQDYQSTIIENYASEWLPLSELSSGKPKTNKAKDNEARRLATMAESIEIDNKTPVNTAAGRVTDKAWMCAETSKLHVTVEKDGTETEGSKALEYPLANLNFGLQERPKTELQLEKNVTDLKITPSVNEAPLLDTANGMKEGLSDPIPATRTDQGLWYFATDITNLQGATMEAEYTYNVQNTSESDYLSSILVNSFTDNVVGSGGVDGYKKELKQASEDAKLKKTGYFIGKYLGETYYTGNVTNNVKVVPTRVETMQESVNPKLQFDKAIENEKGIGFKTISIDGAPNKMLDESGEAVVVAIDTVIENKAPTNILTPGKNDDSKKVLLSATLNTQDELLYASFVAEITAYTNAAGRRDSGAMPGNLQYVYTEAPENDSGKGINQKIADNGEVTKFEHDDHWAEDIKITKPTGGEDRESVMTAIIITSIISVSIVGLGILTIKKFVLQK